MEDFKPHSKIVRLFYFWAGIIATLAYRVIIIFTNFDPLWNKVSWYIGTIGFIFYFAHRFRISEKREHLIIKYKLDKKIARLDGLADDDKAAMGYVFGTLVSSKERWNSIFIFVTSGLALLIGIYLDFIQ